MQTHAATLNGKFGALQGSLQKEKIWKSIVDDLNKVGPQKTIDQWKKVSCIQLFKNIGVPFNIQNKNVKLWINLRNGRK